MLFVQSLQYLPLEQPVSIEIFRKQHGKLKKYFMNFVKNLQLIKRMLHETCRPSSGGAYLNRLVWIDLELTGLELTDRILEIACIVTEANLNKVDIAPPLVINQPEHILEKMGPWCTRQHTHTGLLKAVRESTMTIEEADLALHDFLNVHTIAGKCHLAGNSIHIDKRFIDKYMPLVSRHLHYRIIDVSTIKELCQRWFPEKVLNAPKKTCLHRALNDIEESIEELNYYKNSIFIQNEIKFNVEERKEKV